MKRKLLGRDRIWVWLNKLVINRLLATMSEIISWIRHRRKSVSASISRVKDDLVITVTDTFRLTYHTIIKRINQSHHSEAWISLILPRIQHWYVWNCECIKHKVLMTITQYSHRIVVRDTYRLHVYFRQVSDHKGKSTISPKGLVDHLNAWLCNRCKNKEYM